MYFCAHQCTEDKRGVSPVYISPQNYFFSCGAAAQRGPWPPHAWGFWITHNDAPQSAGLLWTSDQLVAETSTWQHKTLTTNIHAAGGIRTHDLSRRAAAHYALDRAATGTGPHNYTNNNSFLPSNILKSSLISIFILLERTVTKSRMIKKLWSNLDIF